MLRWARSERQVVRAGCDLGGRRAVLRNGHLVRCGGFALAPVLSWARRTALEQHLTGPEGDRLAPVVLLVGPLAPVELGVDDDPRALLQVLGTRPRLGAVDFDGEVVRLVHPLLAVAAARGRSDSQTGDLDAGAQLAHL